MSEELFNNIVEKINTDNYYFEEEEEKMIMSNEQLLQMVIDKIRKNKRYSKNTESLFQELNKYIDSKENSTYLFNTMLEDNDLGVFLDFDLNDFLEYGVDVDSYIKFVDEHMMEILRLQKSTKFNEITNKRIIDYIVNNKLYEYVGDIKLTAPDEKVENFIIEALQNNIENIEMLYTKTPRIKEYCKQNNITYLHSRVADASNEEEVEQLFSDIKNGFVNDYDMVSISVREEYRYHPNIILLSIIKYSYLPTDSKTLEVIKENPSLIKEICSLIENKKIDTTTIDRYSSIPQICATILSKTGRINQVISSDINEEDKVNIISEYLSHHMEQAYEVTKNLLEENLDTNKNITLVCLKKCTLNEIIKLFGDPTIKAYDIFDEYFEKNGITSLPLPNNFSFDKFFFSKSNVSDNIIKILLNSASKEQLTPENFYVEKICQSEELLQLLTSKLIEYKSTAFNDNKMFLETPIVLKLVADPTNPLGIEFSSITKISVLDAENIDAWIRALNATTSLSQSDFDFIYKRCFNNPDDKEAYRLLEIVINSNIDLSNVEIDIVRDDKEFLEFVKPLMTRCKNVSIKILNYYDRDTIKQCIDKYDDEFFEQDRLTLLKSDIVRDVLYEKIKERLNSNKNVSIYLLFELHIYGLDFDKIIDLLDNQNIIYRFERSNFNELQTACSEHGKDFKEKLYMLYGSKMINQSSIKCLGDQYAYSLEGYRNFIIECIRQDKIDFFKIEYNEFRLILKYDDVLDEVVKNKSFVKSLKAHYMDYGIVTLPSEVIDKIKPVLIEEFVEEYGEGIRVIFDNFEFKKVPNIINMFKGIQIISKSPEELNKFIKLIKAQKLDENTLKNINESLLSSTFAVDNSEDYNIYTTLCSLCSKEMTEEEKEEIISKLINYLPNNIDFEMLLKEAKRDGHNDYYDKELIELYSKDKKTFMMRLFDLIQKDPTNYMTYLSIISSQYRISKRNEYTKNNPPKISTNVKVNYKQKNLNDKLFNYLLKENVDIIYKIINEDDKEILYTLYYLAKQFEKIPPDYDIKSKVGKNIPVIKAKFYDRIADMKDIGENLPEEFAPLLQDPKFIEGLPIDSYDFPERTFNDMYNLFDSKTGIKLDILFDKIINDEEKYNCLLELIEKYKILDWGNVFDKQLDKVYRSRGSSYMYNFINSFSKIYDNKKKAIERSIKEMEAKGYSKEEIEEFKRKNIPIRFKPIEIIGGCKKYSVYGNEYIILLGLEDHDLIVENKPPNNNDADPKDRLQKNADVQFKMIQTTEVSIPSFIKDKELGNGRKLRAIVGNRMDTRNLTHGERTGACMRAFGVGRALYEFCDTDYRGFHITIEDPITGEYVSRVSGFRNGNTVWLNELRESCSSKYTNEEILEFAKEIAREIIEQTKDSEYPIVNVAVEKSCAAATEAEQIICNDSEIGKGIPVGYINVKNHAVLLASTNPDNTPAPVEFYTEQPKYEAVRLPAKEYKASDEDLHFKIQRISALKKCLEHQDDPNYYHNITLNEAEFDKEYIYVIVGQDWFVALDSKLEITFDIVPIDKRAEKELQEALDKVNQYKEQFGMGGIHK